MSESPRERAERVLRDQAAVVFPDKLIVQLATDVIAALDGRDVFQNIVKDLEALANANASGGNFEHKRAERAEAEVDRLKARIEDMKTATAARLGTPEYERAKAYFQHVHNQGWTDAMRSEEVTKLKARIAELENTR